MQSNNTVADTVLRTGEHQWTQWARLDFVDYVLVGDTHSPELNYTWKMLNGDIIRNGQKVEMGWHHEVCGSYMVDSIFAIQLLPHKNSTWSCLLTKYLLKQSY